jgi:hypothetical protein
LATCFSGAAGRCARFVARGVAGAGGLTSATNVGFGAARRAVVVVRRRGALLPLRLSAAPVWLWAAGALLAAGVCDAVADAAGCVLVAGGSAVDAVVAGWLLAGGSAGGAGVGGVGAGGVGAALPLPLPFPFPLPGPTLIVGLEPSLGTITSTLGTRTLIPPWPGGSLAVGTGTSTLATPGTSMFMSAPAGATATPANASAMRAIDSLPARVTSLPVGRIASKLKPLGE